LGRSQEITNHSIYLFIWYKIKVLMLSNISYPKTRDSIIRKALKRKLLLEHHKNDPETIIVEELGLEHGATRVDLAVVNGTLHGFELKSDLDSLMRLPEQMRIYNLILDQVTLVVGKDHLHEATNMVPDWWGIILAKQTDFSGNIKFCEIRTPEDNPKQDSLSIARLLWKHEATNILKQLNQISDFHAMSRSAVYERLVGTIPQEELKLRVRRCLSSRINWRPAISYKRDGD